MLFAQVDLTFLYEQSDRIKEFIPIPTFPAITRDISLAVKNEIKFEQLRSLARDVAGELLSEIKFQELYLGEKIPAGNRGYVFSLIYQSPSRTLTEGEVNKTHESVIRALVERLNAVIR